MARLVTSGFEWQTAALGGTTGTVQVDGLSTPGNWSNDTTNQRSGAAALSLAVTSAVSNTRLFSFTAPASGTGLFARIYFQKSADIGTARLLCGFRSQFNYSIQMNADGTLSLIWNKTTVVGSASAALSNNTYYRIELSETMNTAAGSDDSAAAYLDGVQFASETNVARGTTMANDFTIGPADTVAAGGVTWIFDDLAVNDSTGAAQNGLPGSGKVVLLRPISDNATGANWVEGAGGTGSLWDAVNNIPPGGVAVASATNTSQIKNVTKDTTGNYDANMTTYTTAGIVVGDTINVAHPHWNIGSSASATISHAMLLVSNPTANAGTESTSTPSAIAGTYATNWFWLWPAAQIVYAPSVTLGTSPVMRVGKRTSSTSAAMSDAMGIYVDYTPAATVLPPLPFNVDFAVARSTNY